MSTSSIDFFKLSPIPMWVSDIHTQAILEVNPAAVHFYGYDRIDFLQMKIADFQEDRVLSVLNKEIGTHKKKDGTLVYVHLQSNFLEFQNKQTALFLVTDFTETVQREKRIQESIERFNIVSKATSDTIWDYTLGDEQIVWNRGIKGVFGHKDIVDNRTTSEWWYMNIHPEDRQRVLDKMEEQRLNKISRWQDEYRFKCGDGSYRYVFDRYFMLFDEQGKPERIISAMEDVTKRKEYLKAIEDQNKRFKEIAWIQSHMVRAPLARILALVDLIKVDQPDEDYQIMLDYLTTSAKELDAVISNIADKAPNA
ncbi:PAS domain-containing protein [Pedobacter sp.]|uniref:PAS domain-containing protein n=1 Tax=Pedobacter sp. TaxID=1411316 RepID=UPI003D7F4867